MNGYIEKRPEAIAAIKKAITEKWNLICMGCGGVHPQQTECELCEVYMVGGDGCTYCPLNMAGDMCIVHYSTYLKWCLSKYAPAEAEAMLEALVQLLPPADRIEFGG